MRVARYLFPKKSYRRRNSIFGSLSAFSLLRLMFRMTLYTITGLFSLGVLIVASLYKLFKRVKDYRHYKDIGMNSLVLTKAIKRMDGRQFEFFIQGLFKANGYKSEVTKQSADGGKDVILQRNGITTYVECKRWFGGDKDEGGNKDGFQIGRVLLQKLVGSCIGDKVTSAIFITTSYYNNNAFEYAKKVPWLELWDLNDVLKMLFKTDVKKIPWIMSKAMEFKQEDLIDGIDSIGNKFDKMSEELDEQY